MPQVSTQGHSVTTQLLAAGRHALAALRHRRDRARTYRQMIGLRDRLLEDVGWNRGDVEAWYRRKR